MTRSRIEIFPLFKNLQITTNGVAGSKSYLDIDVPGIRHALPHCEALWLITLMEGVAVDIVDWNITCFSGIDRTHEPAGFDISVPDLTAPVSARSADYATTSTFQLDSRLQLWYANHAGVSGAKSPSLTAVLGARRYGQ